MGVGDEAQVAWNGTRPFVSCGGNCKIVATTAGVTESQADVFPRRLQGSGHRRAEKNAWLCRF